MYLLLLHGLCGYIPVIISCMYFVSESCDHDINFVSPSCDRLSISIKLHPEEWNYQATGLGMQLTEADIRDLPHVCL